MEATLQRSVKDLGLAIERKDDITVLRRLHEAVQLATEELVQNVQEFKLSTITQQHKHTTNTVTNDWFITPFDAYIKS